MVVVISIEQKRMTFTIFGFVGVGLAILVSILLLYIDIVTHEILSQQDPSPTNE